MLLRWIWLVRFASPANSPAPTTVGDVVKVTRHALELLSKTQHEIPDFMQDYIAKQEKVMKINPPADRRAKAIKAG